MWDDDDDVIMYVRDERCDKQKTVVVILLGRGERRYSDEEWRSE